MKIGETRKEYKKRKIIINSDCPILTFKNWYKKAEKKVSEPNAFNLATSSGKYVSSRMMLLKDYGETFIFFTNFHSRKGVELFNNSKSSMNFWWKEIQQQIRIDGVVKKIQKEESKAYFYSRPKSSQIGAFLSNQSRKINSYEELIKEYKLLIKKYKNDIVPYPKNWGGYELTPYRIEFWQGGSYRLHQRVEFIKARTKWQMKKLAP